MNMQKVEFDIQKVYMDGPIRGYVRICDNPLTHGGNLDHICALEMFFGLILQEFCDFSGTWDLHYQLLLRMPFLYNFWFSAIFLVFRR